MSRTAEQAEASGSRKKKMKLSSRLDEQIYLEKLNLAQLMDGTNLEYLKKVKELKEKYQERLRLNQIWKENRIEIVEKLYEKDKKDSTEEFLLGLGDLLDPTAEFCSEGDSCPIESIDKDKPQEKHAVRYLLSKEEIEEDLQAIETGFILPLQTTIDGSNFLDPDSEPRSDLKIENKKLLYNKNWYCRGQSVFVSGENLPEFPAVIFSIGHEMITFKNANSGMNVKISLKLLLQSKIQINRRHS